VFPELAALARAAPPASARQADPRGRLDARVATATGAPVAALVFVQRAYQPRLAPMPPLETLAALVRQSPWVVLRGAAAGAHLAALRDLAVRVPAFRLEHTPANLGRAADLVSSCGPVAGGVGR
jgi:hypothetical protein